MRREKIKSILSPGKQDSVGSASARKKERSATMTENSRKNEVCFIDF